MFPVIKRVLLALILLTSCNHKDSSGKEKINELEEKYSYEIYSQLIEGKEYLNYVALIPPPPERYTTHFTEKDYLKLRDSLTASHQDSVLRIAVSPVLFKLEESSIEDLNKKIDIEPYKSLNDLKKEPIDLSKISYDKNKVELSLLDTVRNTEKWEKRFKTNHIIVSFSRVLFSKDFKKAFLVYGVTTSKFDSFSSLVSLIKDEKGWKRAGRLDEDTEKFLDVIKND